MKVYRPCATSLNARARTCVYPCVCMRLSARVGDDALQTWVKSRGGREFLCASRPVPLPCPPFVSSVRSAATLPPPAASPFVLPSVSVLPLASGLQPWGRFESGSRWTRGKSRESGASGGVKEAGVDGRGEGEAERAKERDKNPAVANGRKSPNPASGGRTDNVAGVGVFVYRARAPRRRAAYLLP